MLLHCCCGPCALALIEELLKKGIKPTLYFFNPNIYPYAEYQKRFDALKIVAEKYQLKLIKGPYNHKAWLNFLNNHLNEPPAHYPENGKRCEMCFLYRLTKVSQWAFKNHHQEFATTLSVNRFKNTTYINQKAKELAQKYNLCYFEFDLDPFKAHQRELELSQELNIYRQKYCGCEFSMKKS